MKLIIGVRCPSSSTTDSGVVAARSSVSVHDRSRGGGGGDKWRHYGPYDGVFTTTSTSIVYNDMLQETLHRFFFENVSGGMQDDDDGGGEV